MARKGHKKKQRTETQHYVPQLYLRGFTNAAGSMFCYDKSADRSYPTTTKAAAQEPNFYEIPPSPGLNVPVNTIEKALGVVETTWAPMLADLIRSADAGGISARQVVEFAPFLVLQWMRTKTYRDMAYEMVKKFGQAQVDELIELNYPDAAGAMTFQVDKKGMPAVQSQMLFDQRLVERMAGDLEHHYWVIGTNETEHPFYTSDNPVVRRGHQRSEDGRLLVGVRDPGIEFAFPLDSRHILLILERTHFATWGRHDNLAVKLTPEQINDYNGLQVIRSCQRVYCAKDNFGVARQVCAARPEVRDPNRPRVRVENTPIIDMRSQTIVIALE
jgi:hypothetical protein